MDNEHEEERLRILAIERYETGEAAESIWISLGRSRRWFYKWLERSRSREEVWWTSDGSGHASINRTSEEIRAIVKMVRLELHNRDLFSGAQAIRWRMEDLCVSPLPCLRTIDRILAAEGLTHRRTGRYKAKGKVCPAPVASIPGAVHQTDFVGPCYLKGGIRFYSMNTVDLATGRCAAQPTASKGSMGEALWTTWQRLGVPQHQQVDNDAVFYGSHKHPRGMGKLIRLCLHHGVEPWFIPLGEPWWNGVVEKFNDIFEDKFLQRVEIASREDLPGASLAFEHRHNREYRYSKLGGRTPLETLAQFKTALRFPLEAVCPDAALKKPEQGVYHVVRFIRSDLSLNIFSEKFPVPLEAQYEYVRATVDVGQQRLRVYLDNDQIDEREYRLR
jgi:transposase InsO family protein